MDSEQREDFAEPGGAPEQAAMPFTPPEGVAAAAWQPGPQGAPSALTAVVERNRSWLFEIEGVHGVAEGRTPIGDDAIRVDIDGEFVRQRLPDQIEGYPVEAVVVPGGFGTLPAGSLYRG